ncbi:putative protein lin-28 -like B-like [Scophthalmus maximus]|uniref:Uncharacterized protein n=1 Tax=Scophthalmus maximus TaxID=52904 RepID=A0A2U9CU48_SCOMX|nr:putative protein lin-28 -like B-like [Scophthalmus maximus]
MVDGADRKRSVGSKLVMDGFRSLKEGEQVEFTYKKSSKGLESLRVTGPGGGPCSGSERRPKGKVPLQKRKPKGDRARARGTRAALTPAGHVTSALRHRSAPQVTERSQCTFDVHVTRAGKSAVVEIITGDFNYESRVILGKQLRTKAGSLSLVVEEC